jgi:hypothetical protein
VSFLQSKSAHQSLSSLLLLLIVQFPFVLRFRLGVFPYDRVVKLLADVAFLFAVFSITQMLIQFTLGKEIAYAIDYNIPEAISIIGFDFLVPLYWSSPVYKSNGFLLAEPSLLSQLIAIGIAAELLTQARLHRLVFLGGGLLCSYSGTGMMMLALFLPVYILRYRRFDLVLLGLCLLPLLLMLQDILQLDAITRRINEFSSTESSGFARFLSSFYTLSEFVFADIATTLFGKGPGTVQEFWPYLTYEAFDPTWGKLIYEYGLVGAVLYIIFFYESVLKIRRPLTFPLVFTYFFLGGYLLNAFIVSQMLVLLAWTAHLDSTGDEQNRET